MVKNLPPIQETLVQSLGQEDPLEKGMATTPVLLPEKSHGQLAVPGLHCCMGFSPSCCYSAILTAVAFLVVEHGL